MDTIDRAAEWLRLKETYRQMSEEELAAIAYDAYQLTDLAKDALQAEVNSRKLDLKLRMEAPEEDEAPAPDLRRNEDTSRFWSDEVEDEEEAPQEFDPGTLDLTVVRRVWDTNEARRTKKILDDTGIPSYLGDQNFERIDEYGGTFEGGVDLKVRAVDQQWAYRTLAIQTPKASPAEEAQSQAEDEAEYSVHCPKCGSTEVVFEGRNGAMEGNEAFNNKFEWHCDSCGYDWEDDGVEQPV